MKRIWEIPDLLALVLLVTICLGVVSAEATTFYVDATGGNDTNDGQTEATAFQTLDKVNSYPLVPGDKVLFKRGEIFRGQLVPQSGDAGVDITYGAYGTGAKPLLLGSKELNQSTDWIDGGNNIWVSRSAFDGANIALISQRSRTE